VRLFVGTSGYSYKEWKGSFYPEDLPDARMLSYYASRLTTVEINNTFYRMPTKDLLLKWKGEVGDAFTFVLKAPQRLTHRKRLADCADDLRFFLDTASVLGESLGPLLFQLPPFFKKDVPRLRDFLALCRRTGARPSSSGTRRGSTTRPTKRCARAERLYARPTPTRAARRGRRSSAWATGATCGCGAPTTRTPT
jgi:uncharacterized protein YecE (DUF72 family)